ncbi:MAG TPA: alpha/beta hydrolase [Chitinophagaceae bacterium]|nr:alpha/beta hydrolase [Chitinophagaceae bacterium]
MKNGIAFILLLSCFLKIACSSKARQLTSATIRAGNLQVYYERVGKGDAILLLHAGLQDHTMWSAQVKALSSQYEVITPDLPYHGKTMGVDTVLLVQDVIRILLDSLHLQKVSVAGLSMGASAALDFIIAWPQRVNKAILISAGINGYEKQHPLDSVSLGWYPRFARALEAGDTAGAAVEFTKAWAEGVYRRGDSLQAPVSKYVYSTTLRTLRVHKMQNWPLLQHHPPAYESLGAVRVPVLVIEGDKDLPYINVSAQYLEKNIPGAKRAVIKGVAHMLNMEKPAELNKLVLDFLKTD